MMKRLLTSLLLVAVVIMSPRVAAVAEAATCNAATWSAVQSCYDAASAGDTIALGSGALTATTGVTFGSAKHIKLSGAGVGVTVLTNNFATGNLITITESAAGNTIVEGIEFPTGTGPEIGYHTIRVAPTSGGQPVLVRNNKWIVPAYNVNAMRFETNRGVIHGNTFIGAFSNPNCGGNSGVLRHKALGLSWDVASSMGTADNLFFETNTVTNVAEGIDIDDNAKTVVRYNTIQNSGILHHGNDTSPMGARHSEIYHNTLNYDDAILCPPDIPANVFSLINIRGGTTVIWNNAIADVFSQWGGDAKEVHFANENLRRNNGDFACYTGGYPVPHQVGRGHNGTSEVTDPTYLWGNTGAGNYGNPYIADYDCNNPSACDYPNTSACFARDSASDYIVANRDYYLSTAKPGYTPYTYPHPLAGGAPADIPSYLIHQNVNGKDEWAISGIQAPNGDIIAAWQEATDELNNDNRIITSRSTDGGRTWSATSELVASAGVAKFEPKFMRVGSTLWNFYLSADANVSSSTGTIFAKTSTDNGVTWSAPTSIFSSGGAGVAKLCTNTNGFVKQFAPNAGRWILPVYGWSNSHNFGSVLYSDNSGANWSQGGNTADDANIWNETSIVERANGDLWMTVRKSASPGGGFIYQSLSTDGGATWSAVTATSHVSPRAQSKPLRLASGKILIVWNNVSSTTNLPRLPLTVGISSDGGVTFDATATIRSVSGDWNNMGVTQLASGNIVVFYTDETPGDAYKRVYAAIFTEALVAPTSFDGSTSTTPNVPGGIKFLGGGKI